MCSLTANWRADTSPPVQFPHVGGKFVSPPLCKRGASHYLQAMSLIQRLFTRRPNANETVRPVYTAIVAHGRDAGWYLAGAPDTVDGRFEMITAIFAQMLLRLESSPDCAQASAFLTELFIDDMDGQLRQLGIGDLVVGKHIGKMMGALGGRLGAYRDAGTDLDLLKDALIRNLWAGADPGAPALLIADRLAQFADALHNCPTSDLLAARLPALETYAAGA